MQLCLALGAGERVLRSVPVAFAILLLLSLAAPGSHAADPTLPEAAAGPAPAVAAAPRADMNSVGPLGHVAMRLEHEAVSDISMLPDTPGALARLWRSFDRDGSPLG